MVRTMVSGGMLVRLILVGVNSVLDFVDETRHDECRLLSSCCEMVGYFEDGVWELSQSEDALGIFECCCLMMRRKDCFEERYGESYIVEDCHPGSLNLDAILSKPGRPKLFRSSEGSDLARPVSSFPSPLSFHPSTDLILRHSIYSDLWRSLALSLATIGKGLLQGQSSVIPREI